MNSETSNNLSLQYLRFTASRCKDIWIFKKLVCVKGFIPLCLNVSVIILLSLFTHYLCKGSEFLPQTRAFLIPLSMQSNYVRLDNLRMRGSWNIKDLHQ